MNDDDGSKSGVRWFFLSMLVVLVVVPWNIPPGACDCIEMLSLLAFRPVFEMILQFYDNVKARDVSARVIYRSRMAS